MTLCPTSSTAQIIASIQGESQNASLKIDDLLWKKCVLFLGKHNKKQAALKAIAGHCVFKINASFYLFAILLFNFFFLDFYRNIPEKISLKI